MQETADLLAALLLPEDRRSDDKAHAGAMFLAETLIALRLHHPLKSDKKDE